MTVLVANPATYIFFIIANCTRSHVSFWRQRFLPSLYDLQRIADFDACLGIEFPLKIVVECHADAVHEDFVCLGDEFRAALNVFLRVLREIVDLQAVQRPLQSRSFVFITDNLRSLHVFVVTVIGRIPAEHVSM